MIAVASCLASPTMPKVAAASARAGCRSRSQASPFGRTCRRGQVSASEHVVSGIERPRLAQTRRCSQAIGWPIALFIPSRCGLDFQFRPVHPLGWWRLRKTALGQATTCSASTRPDPRSVQIGYGFSLDPETFSGLFGYR